ncbi:MAG: hypothetical protein PF588_03115 [Candidatus Kapabacteria bacterium]|nr:hypothetical protein [Candidatus Kapabacteria bacterium]
MKILSNILILIGFILLAVQQPSNAQQLNSTGNIINKGKIIVKQQAVIEQASIDGEVEFVWDRDGMRQYIPQISYESVKFSGRTPKYLSDTTKILTARKKFVSEITEIIMVPQSMIYSQGVTEHEAQINPAYGYGTVKLNGLNAQDISGKGGFKVLELDNWSGADVIKGGGFVVNTKLELTRGEMRNDSVSNFLMKDSALIVRNDEGSLRYEANFEDHIDVHYIGSNTYSIATGGEIPSDPAILQTMQVRNRGGVDLSMDVTVNDTLLVASHVNTEPTADLKVLTYTSAKNPIYEEHDAEVIGSLRRTNLKTDSSQILFNNRYTYALFENAAAAGAVKELTFRVKPLEWPIFTLDVDRVKRYFAISARDENSSDLSAVPNMQVGYGWRQFDDSVEVDESLILRNSFAELGFERWVNGEWEFIESSQMPAQLDGALGWAYSYATIVTEFGEFAVGLNTSMPLRMRAIAFLEGAYRKEMMSDELRIKKLIPTTPDNSYPYNLDPTRASIAVIAIPDSVVDWVVLEFRSSLTGEALFYKTCFVRTDGTLVNQQGDEWIQLDAFRRNAEFYVAVRHRNHLSIITESKMEFVTDSNLNVIDFTNPSLVLGGSASLKLIGRNSLGKLIFAMPGGDTDGNGEINRDDLERAWIQRDNEGYLRSDIHMSGIINTRDFNYIWNNQGRTSQIK